MSASVEDLDFHHARGLDRSLILSLVEAHWVAAHRNVLIVGPTGVGRTFVACVWTTRRRESTIDWSLAWSQALTSGRARRSRRVGHLVRWHARHGRSRYGARKSASTRARRQFATALLSYHNEADGDAGRQPTAGDPEDGTF